LHGSHGTELPGLSPKTQVELSHALIPQRFLLPWYIVEYTWSRRRDGTCQNSYSIVAFGNNVGISGFYGSNMAPRTPCACERFSTSRTIVSGYHINSLKAAAQRCAALHHIIYYINLVGLKLAGFLFYRIAKLDH
jgi:hypothetical protein